MSATHSNSNRVPISVNGAPAEAVVSSGSDIPNSWMSFDYFHELDLDSQTLLKCRELKK